MKEAVEISDGCCSEMEGNLGYIYIRRGSSCHGYGNNRRDHHGDWFYYCNIQKEGATKKNPLR